MANVKKLEPKAGFLADFGQKRLLTHLGLFGFTLLGILAAYLYEPTSQLNDILSLGTGYIALILLVVTLAIGTLNLMLKRKNSVNLNFRRDVGIWCGITGVFHGLVSLTLYNSGLLSYFLTKSPSGSYSFEFNLDSLSNIVGVLALVIMLVLLITSNNLSMRYLKGKSWKFVQRFNYPLFVLVVVHAIGYTVLNLREGFFTFLLVALVIFTILAQIIGVIITIQREGRQAREAEAKQLNKTPTLSADELEQNRLARRRFLVLAGVTLIAGVGSSGALAAAIGKANSTTQASTANNAIGTSSSAATATVAGAGTTPVATGTSGSGAVSGAASTPVATAANPAATSATGAVASSGATPTTATVVSGTKILNLSSLPVSNATNFTTPDTNETCLVIHEQDGSVKAFSNICTHRPYNLVYQASSQTLYCALHNANFDAKTGAVLNGPPKTALKSFNVQVDSQGNVIYSQS